MKVTVTSIAALVAACCTGAASAGHSGPLQSKIAFTSNRTGQDEIVVANADGSDRVDLGAAGRFPEFSPDGRRIAFASDRAGAQEIYVMNADGSGQTRLTTTTVYDSRPQWTPDGRRLVFTRILPDGNWEIFRMNTDGSDVVDLTNNPAVEWGQSTRGGQILFTREDNGVGHIYEMNLEGRGVRRITNTPSYDSYPDQSPRGDLILFARDTPDGTGDDLWVTHSDGRGEQQLTHQSSTGYILDATWSPDGSQILYSQCGPGGANPCVMHVMNADGSGSEDVSTPAIPFGDSFDGNAIDTATWWLGNTGTGATVAETNGQLEITVPPAATPDPGAGYLDTGVILNNCRLVGNFDVQADYRLLEWPPASLVNVDFNAVGFDANGNYTGNAPGMFVFDPGSGTGISSNFPGEPNAFAPYPALSGKVRLTRSGDGLTTSYWNGTTWTALATGPFTAPQASVSMDVFSNAAPFTHPEVKIAFDNFSVNSGTFSCPSWWSDDYGDWAPLRAER
jgi:dipeptidyl aminopeptidase/acylaminoacyl peptidase